MPTVYATFEREGVLIRRGEVTMMAGPPGTGKSSLALDIATKMQRPTLYFSADSTELTQATRLGSLFTGRYMFDIEQNILADPIWASSVLKAVDHIRWSWDSAPSFHDVDQEIAAFEEVWGEPPHLIVVDNVTDVSADDGDEFSTLRATMRGLKYTARDKNAAVLVLHHTSESELGNPCPPRRAIHGKISQIPAVVLTVGIPHPSGFVPIACVKSRQGRADITGSTAMRLSFDPSVMQVADIQG